MDGVLCAMDRDGHWLTLDTLAMFRVYRKNQRRQRLYSKIMLLEEIMDKETAIKILDHRTYKETISQFESYEGFTGNRRRLWLFWMLVRWQFLPFALNHSQPISGFAPSVGIPSLRKREKAEKTIMRPHIISKSPEKSLGTLYFSFLSHTKNKDPKG